MVYIDVYLPYNMKQKLELHQQIAPLVFEKETTLMDLFTKFLVSKNLDLSRFDEYAKLTMFSVDNELPNVNGKPLSLAQTLDVVVKPDQEVKFLPRLAGG